MKVTELDHLVLTVADIEATSTFYRDVLGMQFETFRPADGSTRSALTFGSKKINLHQIGSEFLPNAANPVAGSADLCFRSETPVAEWVTSLQKQNISIEEGPVKRTGATGPILSIYLRDPDGNLIEISNAI